MAHSSASVLRLVPGSRYLAYIWDESMNFSLVGEYLAQKIPCKEEVRGASRLRPQD